MLLSVKNPRVTLIGAFIRKVGIDASGGIDVLRGEGGFVGPRPQGPSSEVELDQEIKSYPCRRVIKPGLTGRGQANHSHGASIEDRQAKAEN